jgi:hypothetical protein
MPERGLEDLVLDKTVEYIAEYRPELGGADVRARVFELVTEDEVRALIRRRFERGLASGGFDDVNDLVGALMVDVMQLVETRDANGS